MTSRALLLGKILLLHCHVLKPSCSWLIGSSMEFGSYALNFIKRALYSFYFTLYTPYSSSCTYRSHNNENEESWNVKVWCQHPLTFPLNLRLQLYGTRTRESNLVQNINFYCNSSTLHKLTNFFPLSFIPYIPRLMKNHSFTTCFL